MTKIKIKDKKGSTIKSHRFSCDRCAKVVCGLHTMDSWTLICVHGNRWWFITFLTIEFKHTVMYK